MSVYSSWIHGNALTIETPLNTHPDDGRIIGQYILSHLGKGAEVKVEGSKRSSWMHLPIPTIFEPVSRFERVNLIRVSLLFECSDASIENVHIYDGFEIIEEFNGLHTEGSFLKKGLYENTFKLTKPHQMKSGVGLSFNYESHTAFDRMANERPLKPLLFVAAAGAEFEISNIIFSTLRDSILRLFPR